MLRQRDVSFLQHSEQLREESGGAAPTAELQVANGGGGSGGSTNDTLNGGGGAAPTEDPVLDSDSVDNETDTGSSQAKDQTDTEFTVTGSGGSGFTASEDFKELANQQLRDELAEQEEQQKYYTMAGARNGSSVQAWAKPLFFGAVVWMLVELLNQ